MITKKIKKTKEATKPVTGFRPLIRSRHPSHNALRGNLQRMPFTSVIRFGSLTEEEGVKVQLNSTDSIRNSSDKLRMKTCFTEGKVRTADWTDEVRNILALLAWAKDRYPIVTKHRFGSRGRGNTLVKSPEQLQLWAAGKSLNEYIFEKYYNFNREYRLHVSTDGCFYTCRKMLKEGTAEKDRWFRNDSNCVWIVETNDSFDKPVNWDDIVAESVKALTSCGLDFGACDVRVQSSKDEKGNKRKKVDFIIVEINSAPSFGDITLQRYKEVLPELLTKKYKK